jgi:hypothetical protein
MSFDPNHEGSKRMTDIVERLRLLNELFLGDEPSQTAPFCNGTAQEIIDLAQEASDEIDRLRNKEKNQMNYLLLKMAEMTDKPRQP